MLAGIAVFLLPRVTPGPFHPCTPKVQMHTKIFILPSVPAVRFLKVGQIRMSANFAALSKPAGVPGDTVPPELGNPGPESARPGQIVLAFEYYREVFEKILHCCADFGEIAV